MKKRGGVSGGVGGERSDPSTPQEHPPVQLGPHPTPVGVHPGERLADWMDVTPGYHTTPEVIFVGTSGTRSPYYPWVSPQRAATELPAHRYTPPNSRCSPLLSTGIVPPDLAGA